MEKYIISGGQPLKGNIKISGAKNVALKAVIAALLSDEPVVIENVPLISDLYAMKEIIEDLGAVVEISQDHKIKIKAASVNKFKVTLESGARLRTSSMVIAPLLARYGKAVIPNPGGCRIGARPIDRHISGLKKMGAKISYKDGYFLASTKGLKGINFRFSKNSHTGTETLILAAVLAKGITILDNAACEPEVDDLISLLNKMGAEIKRIDKRKIRIKGVKKLKGASYRIMADRNEAVTYAIAGIVTDGDITVSGIERQYLKAFLEKLSQAKAGWQAIDEKTTRFYSKGNLFSTQVVTRPYPGFMTDWQAPWSLLCLKAKGNSIIHETIYESRFGYVKELAKMGAKIYPFAPEVNNPASFYNFDLTDQQNNSCQAIKIIGPVSLHNAVLEVSDLRAGATLVIAALSAKGQSHVLGIEHIDRGYENFEVGLKNLGATIKRTKV